MGCGCKSKTGDRYKVRMPGGMTITKNSEAEAKKFSAKHPGSTVVKVAK
jgi:hypothetical protein